MVNPLRIRGVALESKLERCTQSSLRSSTSTSSNQLDWGSSSRSLHRKSTSSPSPASVKRKTSANISSFSNARSDLAYQLQSSDLFHWRSSQAASNFNRFLVPKRSYSRDPLQAEHEANTVRGHRYERARTEQLRAKALEEETARGSPAASSSASSTGSEQSSQGRGQNERRSSKNDDNVFAQMAQTWRSTPTRWYPIPIILGALVLVGIQARRNYIQDKKALENGGRTRGGKIVDENGHVVTMQGPWTVYVIGALPLNAISRAWGWANNLTLPVWFRPFGFKLYARIFGCNLDEMKDPDLTKYRSLGEFFYRELKDGVRPIANTTLVSPADGKVLHFGSIEGRRVEQVKGITYSLDALLGTSSPAESLESLDLPPSSGSSKKSQSDDILDEERFANVNGIEYSLDSLLGNDKRKSKRWNGPLGVNRVVHWSWWKSWVVRPTRGTNTTGIPPTADLSVKGSKDQKSSSAPSQEDEEEVEAGMPTPDTPEVLGRYANVAYEMGSGALPPILQPHSPGHEGLREGNKLFFCVVYLAPGDYHRFHSPASWIVERRRHFRGELYSVSPYMASRLGNLFVLNERVALLGRWRYGFFGMIPVGATNVGSIRINFDRALRTNVRDQRALAGTYSEASYGSASRLLGGQPLLVGTEMGGFLLGSTIVLVFEAPENFKFEVEAGSKIKVGEKLGNVAE